jgi:pre-mRNA-splicing factor CDC5/CEF1
MSSTELEIYDSEELLAANQLINEEVNENQVISLKQFESTWESLYKDKVYVPNGDNDGEYLTKYNKNDLLSSLNMQFTKLRGKIEKDSKKANKIESKLNLTTNGYDVRSKKLNEMILDSYENYSNLVISHKSFMELQKVEKKMLPKRINKLYLEMIECEENEKKLQLKYKHLLTLITKQQDLAKVVVSN